MKHALVVDDLDEAMDAIVRGESVVGHKSETAETLIQTPLKWVLPRSVDRKIKEYVSVMDEHFPYLRRFEVGFMNVYGESSPNRIEDAMLMHQLVSPGLVDYSAASADEFLRRLDSINEEKRENPLRLFGITHIHPGEFLEPSHVDLDTFKKFTGDNWVYQNFYGWADVSNEFAQVDTRDNIREALKSQDGVVLRDRGEPKIYFRVNQGYSLFLIYCRGIEEPWFGLGEYKKYCFNGGPESYRLLEKRDGLELKVEDDVVSEFDSEMIRAEINYHVKPLVIPEIKRPTVIPRSIQHSSIFYHDPQLLRDLERKLPMTGGDLFRLLNHFMTFARSDPKANMADVQTVQRVLDLFGNPFVNGSGYEQQYNSVDGILRGVSPSYCNAMELKERLEKRDIGGLDG
ncbi:MAG: hypothetical protein PHF67_00670 [Candidatus Nanoarchaeia archaeon]|nr:hypothetical protein [Candidatus Nanoarchaeia archaeon]